RRPTPAPPPPAVLSRTNGILARDVPPRHPATAPRPPDQPVPPGPAALSPAGQPLDPRRGAARGQPQPAKRPRAEQGGTSCPGQAPAGGGLPARGGPGVGPLEPGDIRRSERRAARRPRGRRLAARRGRPGPADGRLLQPARPPSHAVVPRVPLDGTAAQARVRAGGRALRVAVVEDLPRPAVRHLAPGHGG